MLEDFVEMRLVATDAHLADSVRIARPQAGIAADAAALARRQQAGLGAFGDQRPLELGSMRCTAYCPLD